MPEKKKSAAVYNEPDVKLTVYFDSVLRNEKKSDEGSFIRVYKVRGGFEGSELVRTYYKVYIPEYVAKEASLEKVKKGNEVVLYGKVRASKQIDVDEQILAVNIDKVKLYSYDFKNADKADKNYGYSPSASGSSRDNREDREDREYRQERKPEPRQESYKPREQESYSKEEDPFDDDDVPF